MARILVYTSRYLPGYRAGGPIISTSRLIENETSHTFRVVTQKKDLGSKEAYQGIKTNNWMPVGAANTAYMRNIFSLFFWATRQSRNWAPQFLYLNSIHTPEFTWFPLGLVKIGILKRIKIVISPTGELSKAALSHHSKRKRFARPIIRFLIGRSVTWHVASQDESYQVIKWWGRPLPKSHSICIQPDNGATPSEIPSKGSLLEVPQLIFASRIHPIKGLLEVICYLRLVNRPCKFTVRGVIEDMNYWESCLDAAEHLPTNVSFEYGGSYKPEEIQGIFAASDLFLFGTKGEGFGQIVSEALSVGCPIVISSHTPWSDLVSDQFGLVSDEPEICATFVEEFSAMPLKERECLRTRTHEAYRSWFTESLKSRGPFG